MYNVKWNGDSKLYKSHEEHLKPVDGMMGDGKSEYEEEDDAEEEASDVEVQMEDEGRDPEADMDDADPEEDRGDESADETYHPPPLRFFFLRLFFHLFSVSPFAIFDQGVPYCFFSALL